MPLSAVNLPPVKAVAVGQKTAADKELPHSGKTVVLVGASNLKRVGAELEKELASQGAKLVTFCEGVEHRALFRMFEPQHLDFLQKCGEKDLLVLHFFGNSMLKIDSHFPETLPPLEPTLPPRRIRHVVKPRILTDNDMDSLLSDTKEILVWAVENFPGRILLAGPLPRYITPCCAENDHIIKDAYNQPVDMVKYTNAMSSHLKNSLDLPPRVEFVDYRQTIAGAPDVNLCPDKVHLSSVHQKKVVSFISNTLSKKPPPPSKKSFYEQTFSDALLRFHVFSKKVNIQVKQELADDDSYPTIDDAIKLVSPPPLKLSPQSKNILSKDTVLITSREFLISY